MRSQGVTNVAITVPQEGAMTLPYLLAIPKGAAGLDEAKQFLAFCGLPPAADKIAERLGYLPVNRKVPFPSSVNQVLGYGPDELMKRLVGLDWTQINANMERLAGVVQKVNAGQR
jgi:spermidine/putrescine-binding protein